MKIKVIAEIGINHKGSLKKAKTLINDACIAGAWAVKFQFRSKNKNYNKLTQIGDEILDKEFKRSFIEFRNLIELSKYAKKLNLKTGISFFNVNEFNKYFRFINHFDFLKVPSSEFLNLKLYDSFLKANKQIIISCGGHNSKQIKSRIKLLKKNTVVMHCVSNYPTIIGFQNLNFLNTLSKFQHIDIGYSSHDKNWEVNIIAMQMKVKYIERHLTLDKKGDGLDDSSSSDKSEFYKLCFFANNFDRILGKKEKIINQGEIINMQNLGTSIFSKKEINKGKILSEKDFIIRSPRTGLTFDEYKKLKSKILKKDLKKNVSITKDYFTNKSYKLNNKEITFCDYYNISLPLRLHDYEFYYKNFPITNYELHLSFNEVNFLDNNFNSLANKIILDYKKYSIHLPDYISNNNIFDPLSINKSIRKESLNVFRKTIKLAKYISNKTKKRTIVVGSFSRINNEVKEKKLKEIFSFLKRYTSKDVIIYPQWLPKIAWYYGGAEIQSLFSDKIDIDFIIKNKKKICLDIAHLILSSNYENTNWFENFKKLKSLTGHFHLSDAKDISSEGVILGKGDLKNIKEMLKLPCSKVIETWQGHLNNGEGFYKTIKYLINNS